MKCIESNRCRYCRYLIEVYTQYMAALIWQTSRGRIDKEDCDGQIKESTEKLNVTINKCERQVKTLILTPNKTEMCGMYQLAKDLAKELDADIGTLMYSNKLNRLIPWIKSIKIDNYSDKRGLNYYDEVITFLYPMHIFGKEAKKNRMKWIVYDQKVPPDNCFKGVFRRMYMDVFRILDRRSKIDADEYWELSEREQKPRWIEKTSEVSVFNGYNNKYFKKLRIQDDWNYALYIGRKTDYKNFDKLVQIMDELKIPFVTPPDNCSDKLIHQYYSGAKLFVTASTWEGYGRPVMEAESLGIPAVSFDTGTHKRNTKKGICVKNYDFDALKDAIKTIWEKNGNKRMVKNVV